MYAVSLLAPMDFVSAASFAGALGRLGVLEYTSDVERIQCVAEEKPPIVAPRYFLVKTSGGYAPDVVERRVYAGEESAKRVLGIPVLAEKTHSVPLKRQEGRQFSAHMQTLARFLENHGIFINRLPSSKQIFTRDEEGYLHGLRGLARVAENVAYVSNRLRGKTREEVILHEGIHLASSLLFGHGKHPEYEADLDNFIAMGAGLEFGTLFGKWDEGLTDMLTATLLGRGTTSSYSDLFWGAHSEIITTLGLINDYYQLRGDFGRCPPQISGGEFDWVTGAGWFMLRAYFARDLTFYGLLYHTLKNMLGEEFFDDATRSREAI